MSKIGWFHFVIANIAIIAGAYNLLFTKKGTRRHRQVGWFYVASMLLANVTALTIYRLFGGFGPFHFFAIISLVAIAGATLTAVKARQSRQATMGVFAFGAWLIRRRRLDTIKPFKATV